MSSCRVGDVREDGSLEDRAVLETLAHEPGEVDGRVDADGRAAGAGVRAYFCEAFLGYQAELPRPGLAFMVRLWATRTYIWDRVLPPWGSREEVCEPDAGCRICVFGALVEFGVLEVNACFGAGFG